MPGEHGGEHHDRIGGGALGGEFGQVAEDHGEDHHGQEGADDAPGDADDGLLVAHQDVAPGKKKEEPAIAPQVAPVLPGAFAGFYDELTHFRCPLFTERRGSASSRPGREVDPLGGDAQVQQPGAQSLLPLERGNDYITDLRKPYR